jgi:hypothetical protein
MIQDDLVAAIVRARETQSGAFGRPRPDRFSTGYIIEPKRRRHRQDDARAEAELERSYREWPFDKFETCGSTEGLEQEGRAVVLAVVADERAQRGRCWGASRRNS